MTNSSGVVAGHATDFLAPRPTLAGAPGNPDVGQPDDEGHFRPHDDEPDGKRPC